MVDKLGDAEFESQGVGSCTTTSLTLGQDASAGSAMHVPVGTWMPSSARSAGTSDGETTTVEVGAALDAAPAPAPSTNSAATTPSTSRLILSS